MLDRQTESGFSLIELLMVLVIIGVVATLAVPALQKGIIAAENGNTFATMRALSSTQMSFYSQNSRFGRLSEVNNLMNSALGVTSGNQVIRGKFVFDMNPAVPTNTELTNAFVITATRQLTDGTIYKYELTQSGEIRQILP